MKLTVNKKIGRNTYYFQAEGNNLFELVSESQKLSFPHVTNCGVCNSDNLELQCRLAREKYKYVFIKCLNCKGELTFGHRTDDPDVFYLRKNLNGELCWQEYTEAANQ